MGFALRRNSSITFALILRVSYLKEFSLREVARRFRRMFRTGKSDLFKL